jgi:hypothetical protein
MTSSGRRWALLIGALIAFALPKHVECGYPGGECAQLIDHQECATYEVEPWGFSLLERVFKRDIGFAYSHGLACGADRGDGTG